MSVPSVRRHPGRARPRRRTSVLLAAGLAVLLAAPGCASKQGETEANAARAEAAPTTVRVENRNFLDMTIYVLRGGQRIRLGLANGSSTARFTIPSRLVFGITTLQFLADPVGSSRTPISQEIRVTEGDEITLTIPPG